MNELKLCPFCGGNASLYGNEESNQFNIMCHDCEASTRVDNLSVVARIWNRRAEQPNEIQWIAVSERLPEAEKRVLVCAESRMGGKVYKHITPAMYEDGTVWREDSDWRFDGLDNLETYDEERDDWKIPEGWWEYTIYNEEEGNYPIDDFVTHWMPLPEPPKSK